MFRYLGNSIYYPKWFLEKQNNDNSLLGKASFVTVPYSSISDSTVNVTDDEIKKYMDAHEEEYQQEEETRSISYVSFNAAPSTVDSIAVQKEVESLKKNLPPQKTRCFSSP